MKAAIERSKRTSRNQGHPARAVQVDETERRQESEPPDPFQYESSTGRLNNAETALRCVTFLLDWLTDYGNNPIEGWKLAGLNDVVRECADRIRDAQIPPEHFAARPSGSRE
jgi:hypothetical protein